MMLPNQLGSRLWAFVLLGNAIFSRAATPQIVLNQGPLNERPSNRTSSPDLAYAGSSVFTEDVSFSTFEHTMYPSYGLRVRPAPKAFCDETVQSFTGYLDTDFKTKHFFFYFFESQNDPDTDDVIVWLSGGMSSLTARRALFFMSVLR